MAKKRCRLSFIGHLHTKDIRIISNKKVLNLKANTSYFLSEHDFYIIICPPLAKLNDYKPSYVIYDSEEKKLELKRLED